MVFVKLCNNRSKLQKVKRIFRAAYDFSGEAVCIFCESYPCLLSMQIEKHCKGGIGEHEIAHLGPVF